MSDRSPLVSVALITFNHEQFIAECIRSVLAQTFADLELVIVDDGSTDRTAEVIATFADPRIVSIRQPNQGPSCAANRALAACRGRFVALGSGDDVFHPDRIEAQLDCCRRAGRGLVLSNLDYIDAHSTPIESCHMPKDCYLLPQLSQGEILQRFFHTGNIAAIATAFFERNILDGMEPFDPVLYQAQDYDWLIRLVKKHPFTFMPRSTMHYRVTRDNLSAPHPNSTVRTHNEIYLIFQRFFDGVTPELFHEAFGGQVNCPASASPVQLACAQAFLLLRHPQFPLVRLIGMEKLHDLFLDSAAEEVLRTQFNYTRGQFVDELRRLDCINHLPTYSTRLFVDTGNGFNDAERIELTANQHSRTFDVTFDLSGFARAHQVAWKLAPFHFCTCWFERIEWHDTMGTIHELDSAGSWSNGERGADGGFTFRNLDPTVIFTIGGEAGRLRLRGRWEVTEMNASLWQANSLLLRQHEQVTQLTGEVGVLSEQVAVISEQLRRTDQSLKRIKQSRIWRCLAAMKSTASRLRPRRAG